MSERRALPAPRVVNILIFGMPVPELREGRADEPHGLPSEICGQPAHQRWRLNHPHQAGRKHSSTAEFAGDEQVEVLAPLHLGQAGFDRYGPAGGEGRLRLRDTVRREPGRRVIPERDQAQMRGRESVDEVQDDRLGVRVGRPLGSRTSARRCGGPDLLGLMGALDSPGGRYQGIGKQVVASQGFQA